MDSPTEFDAQHSRRRRILAKKDIKIGRKAEENGNYDTIVILREAKLCRGGALREWDEEEDADCRAAAVCGGFTCLAIATQA
jgi:hypothetical protein